ncbi:unnamed protein product [Rotaria sp. Silwood1]|nr:unnamed protein product [Rotaria sp. Silwood1]CAF1653003.1 unnamed protein product [Rotaria sp. Silwood1]CAF4881779.1 unnamed protein product [Rotaria sp. Silwood1]
MPVNIIVTVRKTMKHVATLNIFDDAASRSNPFNFRTAIISTRFYFVLLILSLITLVIFTSLSNENISITIRNPSEASYEYLLNTYSRTLSCQCSRTTIPYSDFTSTDIKYHPVCSSMFVSYDWIDCLLSPNMNTLYQADFRAFASTFFQLLAIYCSHAQRSINDALDDLRSETLLTPDVLSFQLLDTKVQAKSEFLQTSTANSLVRLLELVRSTTYTDTLYSAFQTSELLLKTTRDNGSITLIEVKVSLFPNGSTECECLITPTCSLPAGFFNGTDIELLARTRQILTQFESTTVAEFKRNLAIIRSLTTTTYTAGYGDVYWYSIPSVYDTGDSYFVPTPVIIENCSCALSDECKNTISLYNYTIDLSVPPQGILFNIPHMYKSCFNMQSLLLSSLECFFERTCFDPIQEIINVIANYYFIINGSVLLTNSTRFSPKTTVGEIINELMIERWYENVRYEEYYQQCAPEQCSYLLPFRNNALYIVTTVIGLFGGLSVALKIIVPIIVRWIRNRMRPQATPANVTG